MYLYRFSILLPVMLISFAITPSFIQAAGQVQLELVGDARNTSMVFQEWGQVLNHAGIKNVHIRAANDKDKIDIDIQGTPANPVYIVTGQIISVDELRLPGQRFRRGDMKLLAKWLDDLAQKGPPNKRPKTVEFGLTEPQLEKVKNDLAVPVGFSTKDLSRREAVEKIAKKLGIALRFEDKGAGALDDEKAEDELSDLSCGTALACLLRPSGFGLLPKATGEQISYSVIKSRPDQKEVWPVGRQPEKPTPAVLPGLYEFLNVNVQKVAAATVLETIGKRLKTPVVYDHLSLEKFNIEPAKALVSFAPAKTNYSLALQKMLFPAGLRFEVREDDAGAPFLWVFSLKPM